MPPPRIVALAREPRLTTSTIPRRAKDVAGGDISVAGYGFGAWGFLPALISITLANVKQAADFYNL